jgi:tetratricopeptide (TPR) repeat protein
VEDPASPGTRVFWEAAIADFTKALERDSRNVQAIDMRGLVHATLGDDDQAIVDFAREMEVDARVGQTRLADAYCRRGSSNHRARKTEPAIADYEKAMELGGNSDACECQPENPLVTLYYEKGDYDRGWDVVRRAKAARRSIAPEILEPLRKASGRTQ